MKRSTKRVIWLIVILLIGFLLFKGLWNSQLNPVSSDKTQQRMVIEKGDSLNQIAQKLKEKNLIHSSLVFSLYVRQMGLSSKLQAGTFNLSPYLSIPEIVGVLTGTPNENWVTLLEGWRVEEMSQEIASKLYIGDDQFLEVAKEGYMFPDTYLFAKDVTAEQIAKAMRDNFDKKYSEDLRSKIRSKGLTEDEGVILASIVEREARSDQARKMVASILLKRFKIGMGLNADATLQYALGYQEKEKSWWKRHLTHEDLKVNSSYNTYIHSGFPPKPIANPSLSSLEAVANANSTTDYLYYYHDSKGNSHYAKTLEEHNQNVANHP